MKKYLQIALGVVTSIGGFLDAGNLATAFQAGAEFRFSLIWAFVLGTICVTFLVEMSGRLAACSHHPLPSAIRERMGFRYFAVLLLAGLLLDFLVLGCEIGGASVAVEMVTGWPAHWCAPLVALALWLLLWNSTFSVIEDGVALLGLVTVAFVVAMFRLEPAWGDVARGALPSLPSHDPATYWFMVVSILGATTAPYLFNFYSSGAVEEKWDRSHLTPNRIVAIGGMGFGSVVSIAVLVAAAVVFGSNGIHVDTYQSAARTLTDPFGHLGYYLFAGSLFIACFGSALEINLDSAYMVAQGFGWNWGESVKPIKAARFSAVYTLFVIPSTLLILLGVDPMKLTMYSMAIATLILPLVVLPFLVLMNDPKFVGENRNGPVGNAAVFAIIALTFLLAVVAIPLQVMGGD